MKEEKIKKATNTKVRLLIEERRKRAKKKKEAKKLKISDIKHGEGTHVGHLLHHIKAKEAQLTFICVFIVLFIILVSLYFVFSSVREPIYYNTIQVGKLEVTFSDRGEHLGNIVDLTPIRPMSLVEGEKTKSYQVKIVNTSAEEQSFQIKLMKDVAMVREDKCSDIQLPMQYIRYQIDAYDSQSLDATKRSPILYNDTVEAGEIRFVEVRLWVDAAVPNEYLDFHFHGKLSVKAMKTAK